MTSATRRALPWLVSAGAHVAALGTLGILLALSPPPAGHRVEISLVGGSGAGGGVLNARSGARGPAASKAPSLPSRASARSAAPTAAVGAVAAAASGRQPSGSGAAVSSSPVPYSMDASRTMDTGVAPSASDVLNDTESATAGAQDAVGGSGGRQADSGGAPGIQAGGPEWGWQGLPRKLLRKRNPEFPAILSALGQEVEGEARITVAPSGTVTRVEITRSSGYIEIDASVEAALRDYLFSRVDGRVDSTGTVKFRFRLEKQD